MIHDPENVLFAWTEEEEEGESIADNIIEKTLEGIKTASENGDSKIFIDDFYTTINTSGTNVSKWKSVTVEEDMKFDVALNFMKVLSDKEKNEVDITEPIEKEENRKYLSVDGKCISYIFKYSNRDGNGIKIGVPLEQREDFENYLFGALIEQFSEAADTAMSCAFSWSGNDMACNIGVRTTLYFHKNDKVLFPVSGSGLFKADQKPYFKGEVTDPGKANNIYDDLDDNSLDEFEEISNASGCNYPDFEELQNQANDGTAIIGVKKNNSGSGHIVVIMPEGFNERDDIERRYNITSNELIILPITLECGQGTKEIRPFENKGDIVEFKWYKYEN